MAIRSTMASVPQTVDALVLGPPIEGGKTVRGITVGLMYMEDEKGPDAKVVLSRPGPDGQPLHDLTTSDQQRIAENFRRYKDHEAGAYSRVAGGGRSQTAQCW